MITLCLALSSHISLPGNWNQVHPCVRFQYDSFVAGAYLNSENRVSAYGGLEISDGKFFAEFGAVTGYSGADVLPFVRAGVRFENGSKLFIAPAYSNGDSGVVVGLEISAIGEK